MLDLPRITYNRRHFMPLVSFGPTQQPLSLHTIKQILDWRPRRMIIGGPDWPDPLHSPANDSSDWRIVLPFCETLQNAFEFGCGVSTIGFRESNGRCWTFLSGTAGFLQSDLIEVNEWLGTIGKYVAIRDGLCMSFALDFDREEGDPNRDQTDVGRLRTRAKPYGGPATADGLVAADALVERLDCFLSEMRAYNKVDAIVAMPPSAPNKLFDLPTHLVEKLAQKRGLDNLTSQFSTTAGRAQMKDVPKAQKVDMIAGTLTATADAFSNRNVLLVDDLYQSGASANVAAMELLSAGARRVFGLFCEKTCRNDDNVT